MEKESREKRRDGEGRERMEAGEYDREKNDKRTSVRTFYWLHF